MPASKFGCSTLSPNSRQPRALSLTSGATTTRRHRQRFSVRSHMPATSSPARSARRSSSAYPSASSAEDDDHLHLHSHITGVDPRLQNRSLGFALKQFQRSWALAHGTSSIRWTADPLVRRNLYFNLCKLGATVVDYYPDFYGPLLDGVNGAGESDRVLLHWELASPRASRSRRPASARARGEAWSGHRRSRHRRLSGRDALSAQKRFSSGSPTTSSASEAAMPVRRMRGAKRSGWRSAAPSPTDTGASRSRVTAGSS